MASAPTIPGASRLRVPIRSESAPAPAPEPATTPALHRKLVEDLSWLPVPWLPQLAELGPDDWLPVGRSNGTTSDRQWGRSRPLFWSEIDLRGFRVLSRHICETNNFGIGFLRLLVNYHVRKGFGWQACRRGVKKSPYPTATTQKDALTEKAQKLLDQWRDVVNWSGRSREAFSRWRRDGDVFGRLGVESFGRLPWFRFIDPSQVGHPQGMTIGPEAFGIATAPGDIESVLAYGVWDHDDPTLHEWVDADKIVHMKANVDSDVKRGLPDFFPGAEEIESCQRLIRTMLATAIRQARIGWIEKFPNATATQVAQTVPEYQTRSGQSVSQESLGGGLYSSRYADGAYPGLYGVNGFRRSDVMKTEGSRQFEPGPTMTGAGGYIQIEQAALRGCGVRWSFPEYFSGDASNNNMASSFVANSPFVTSVECTQEEWAAGWERKIALKVLELCVVAGLLSHEEWSQLDVELTSPAVATPEPEKDTQILVQQKNAGFVDDATAIQKLGYDPQHVMESIKRDKQAAPPQPAPGQPAPGEQPQPDADAGGSGSIFGEDRAGLVKKVITNKDGKQQTVYVRPNDPAQGEKSAKAVPSLEELKALHSELAGKMPDLPPDQFEAAGDYTSGAYVEINRSLREDRPATKGAKAIPLIEKAIDSAPTLDKPITVYRGLRLSAEQAKQFLQRAGQAKESGELVQEPGFMSTSINPKVATDWVTTGTGSESPIVFEIAATKGLYLGESVGGTKEMEFLIQRGTKFKVTGIRQDGPGHVVTMEQVA